MDSPWHGNRESVYAAIRELGAKNEANWATGRRLSPPKGTVGVGGADFDYNLKAIVGDEYLRSLRRGTTPQEALVAAAAAGTEAVVKWNVHVVKGRACFGGRHELRLWEGAGASRAEDVHYSFLAACRAAGVETP